MDYVQVDHPPLQWCAAAVQQRRRCEEPAARPLQTADRGDWSVQASRIGGCLSRLCAQCFAENRKPRVRLHPLPFLLRRRRHDHHLLPPPPPLPISASSTGHNIQQPASSPPSLGVLSPAVHILLPSAPLLLIIRSFSVGYLLLCTLLCEQSLLSVCLALHLALLPRGVQWKRHTCVLTCLQIIFASALCQFDPREPHIAEPIISATTTTAAAAATITNSSVYSHLRIAIARHRQHSDGASSMRARLPG